MWIFYFCAFSLTLSDSRGENSCHANTHTTPHTHKLTAPTISCSTCMVKKNKKPTTAQLDTAAEDWGLVSSNTPTFPSCCSHFDRQWVWAAPWTPHWEVRDRPQSLGRGACEEEEGPKTALKTNTKRKATGREWGLFWILILLIYFECLEK